MGSNIIKYKTVDQKDDDWREHKFKGKRKNRVQFFNNYYVDNLFTCCDDVEDLEHLIIPDMNINVVLYDVPNLKSIILPYKMGELGLTGTPLLKEIKLPYRLTNECIIDHRVNILNLEEVIKDPDYSIRLV